MTYGGGGGGGGLGGEEILMDRLGISEANLTRGKVGFGLAECAWSLLEVGREGGGVGLGGDCSDGEVVAMSIANSTILRGA